MKGTIANANSVPVAAARARPADPGRARPSGTIYTAVP